MSQVLSIYQSIVHDLEVAGKNSPYPADANETDPRYKSYGVRAAGKKTIISQHKKAIRALSQEDQMRLATKLMTSEYGEQQSVALFILEPYSAYYTPSKMVELDSLVRCLYGWSKVDSFTGSLLRDVLFNYPTEMIDLLRRWNADQDMWLKRTSVVLFTRKVAKSGQFTDIALEMCDNLIFDKEPLVLKGIGWALKDLMKSDKNRILDYIKTLRQKGVSNIVTLYAIRDLKGKERRGILNNKL